MDKIINRTSTGKGPKRIFIFFGACLVAIVAISAYLIFVPKTCYTTDCFAKAANDCRKAKLDMVDDADILWSFRAEAFCGGFEKNLIYLSEDETANMKKLLEGKSLSCDYKKRKFDQRWLTSAIFGLENCRGELKETLGQLLFLSQ